ncbi:serine hydrolase domain-containing protein [Bacteroidota bacterium]
MKRLVSLIFTISFFLIISCTSVIDDKSTEEHGYSTPEAEGISSNAILKFVEALEKEQPDAIHSIMLRRHGKIVAQGWWEPFNPDSPHMLYSLSKSFTSTAIWIAQDEGLVSINDQVISFFPNKIPEDPGDNLKAMRIRDLLKMNSGHQWGISGGMIADKSWVEGFLGQEVQHKPGTHFVYSSGATYMLSAIIQKVTGITLLEYLKTRLFEPLGIENPTWESDPDGINKGGTGLSVTTEDISKLGQLYLQKGMWNGERLISEDWVDEATSLQTSNGSNPESDWEQGYGYQFWRCRHNLYRGDGAFGQFCIVMPEYNAVLVITSGSNDMQGIMNIAWRHILPAMKDDPLPTNEEALNLLNEKLSSLKINTVKGNENSQLGAEISGKTFEMEPNEMDIMSVTFDFDISPNIITIVTSEGEKTFKAGNGSMETGELKNPQLISRKIAASGAWEEVDKYIVNLIYFETPHAIKFTYQFKDEELLWNTDLNVSFGQTEFPQLKGNLK